MANQAHYKNEIDKMATQYSSDISWLAGIHYVLRLGSPYKSYSDTAQALLVNPERYVNVNTNKFTLVQVRNIFEKIVAIFNKLRPFALEAPSDNPGHYLNKSAILHIDALLQGFLDRLFELACSYKRINALPSSNSSTDKNYQKQEKSIKSAKLDSQNVNRKIDEILDFKELRNTNLKHANHAKCISQLRHIITHRGGFVDEQFLKNCGAKNHSKPPIWDTSIWKDTQSFLQDYEEGQQASVAIDKILLPYMDHAVDFIQEMANVFKNI